MQSKRSIRKGPGFALAVGLLIGGFTASDLVRKAMADSHEKVSTSDVGRDYYLQYCAVCHGQEARGDGEYAGLLKMPPPDLTKIADRRGGEFPSLEIADIVDGRKALRAHGTSEMPVWAERFQEERPSGQGGGAALGGRTYVLVEYLRSIQPGAAPSGAETEASSAEPSRSVADIGGEFFARNCAACHGGQGKGDGYLGTLLDKPPADLTKIAARRGGTFPSLEIAEIIDGRREVRAHGPPEMPIWGEEFARTKSSSLGKQSAIRGEVMVYVEYLRSIQEP